MIFLVTCFIFVLIGHSQNLSDSVTDENKINYNLISGFKLTKNNDAPNIYTSSIIGIEIKPDKINFGFAYRNFFNTQFIGKRDNYNFANKSIRFMTITNSFDLFYLKKYKKDQNFSKIGVGIYFERDQSWYDQYFIYQNSHAQGIELSYYTKLKWIHIGLRQKIQIFTEFRLTSFDILDRYYTQLCFEFPIKLK